MRFARALEILRARQESRISLGLGRVASCLKRLGDPHRRVPAIHVAGTNGKGSVCAMLESVLRQAGVKTGLYTSPHLSCVRERILVGGRPIPEPDFARLLSRVLKADPSETLTYFELLTAVAFLRFAERGVRVAVLETGLGGRLDATNVVEKPLVSVITSIAKDHTEHLGSTLAGIAAEKAGIIKRGSPVVCPALPGPAMRVVRAAAERLGAPLVVARRPPRVVGTDWARNLQLLEEREGRRWTLSLLGTGQARNVALARAALAQCPRLGVSERAWEKGLSLVRWPCRFEVRAVRGGIVVIDGAHNVSAVGELCRTLDASPWARRRTRFIIGMLRDKDAAGMLRVLGARLSDVVVCRPDSPRSVDPVDLARLVRRRAPGARVAVEHDVESALRSWLGRAGAAPRVAVVCGSFYLAGRAGEVLGRQ
ncbi:MAG: bifunctional folylpolyglutamate synthase/dihydrofolate synthase [Elusimicrobia bacterium]|nr:bifunctional folylpolyglutamate synthase/dihydrofolate synthase [Elusimicrobiota bacterium]